MPRGAHWSSSSRIVVSEAPSVFPEASEEHEVINIPDDDDAYDSDARYDPDSDPHLRKLHVVNMNGFTLKISKTVALRDGDFMRINSILQDRYNFDTFVRGPIFRRNLHMDDMLEKKKNEVTMLQQYDPADSRNTAEQSKKMVRINEVVKVRKLVMTNALYPAKSFRDDANDAAMGKEWILANGRLACRRKHIIYGPKNECLVNLSEAEVDAECDINGETLTFLFRGETTKGGSCRNWLPGEKNFDKAERTRCHNVDPLGFHGQIPRIYGSNRRYTLGDTFCGAGGVSRAAKGAGIRVSWGVDCNEPAIRSFTRNFVGATCHGLDTYDFVNVVDEETGVDIIHISSPCKTFSPLHTVPGKNDDANSAAFFAVEELLKKGKPRIVTLEQTFGLMRGEDKMMWFRALIHVFTSLGFSVRWKVFNFAEYGLAQPRKRLMLFAAW